MQTKKAFSSKKELIQKYLDDSTSVVEQLSSNVSTLLLATALHSPVRMQDSIDKHCVLNFVTLFLYKDEYYKKIIKVNEESAEEPIPNEEYKPIAYLHLKQMISFI